MITFKCSKFPKFKVWLWRRLSDPMVMHCCRDTRTWCPKVRISPGHMALNPAGGNVALLWLAGNPRYGTDVSLWQFYLWRLKKGQNVLDFSFWELIPTVFIMAVKLGEVSFKTGPMGSFDGVQKEWMIINMRSQTVQWRAAGPEHAVKTDVSIMWNLNTRSELLSIHSPNPASESVWSSSSEIWCSVNTFLPSYGSTGQRSMSYI